MNWKPISTAPKLNGQQILTYRLLPANDRHWFQTSFWSERWGLWVGFPKDRQPTHWMPLPAPPEQ